VGAFQPAQRRQNQKFLVGVERRRCLEPQSFGPGPILANVKTDRSYVPPRDPIQCCIRTAPEVSRTPGRLPLHNPPYAVYNPLPDLRLSLPHIYIYSHTAFPVYIPRPTTRRDGPLAETQLTLGLHSESDITSGSEKYIRISRCLDVAVGEFISLCPRNHCTHQQVGAV
jgi:hypothetical protein